MRGLVLTIQDSIQTTARHLLRELMQALTHWNSVLVVIDNMVQERNSALIQPVSQHWEHNLALVPIQELMRTESLHLVPQTARKPTQQMCLVLVQKTTPESNPERIRHLLQCRSQDSSQKMAQQ